MQKITTAAQAAAYHTRRYWQRIKWWLHLVELRRSLASSQAQIDALHRYERDIPRMVTEEVLRQADIYLQIANAKQALGVKV